MAPGERLAQLAAEAAGAPTPGAALRKVGDLRRELDAFERRQVAQALAEGLSFAAIARDLGLSRQAVHRRFRDLSSRDVPLLTGPDVRRVLRHAREAAAALGTNELRSEHVLLAILGSPSLRAAAVLRDAGVTLERAQVQVEAATPRTKLFRREQLSAGDLHALLAAPVYEARRRGSDRIQVEHLLLGVLHDPSSGASRVLRALGVEPDAIRTALEALLDSRSEPAARSGRSSRRHVNRR